MAISSTIKIEKEFNDVIDYLFLDSTLTLKEDSLILNEVYEAYSYHYSLNKITSSGKKTIQLVLANLLNNHGISVKTAVMLSRTGAPYKDFGDFKFNQDVMKKLISFLEAIGYLEVIRGFSIGKRKVPTRLLIKDSSKLQACLIEQRVQSRFTESHTSVLLTAKDHSEPLTLNNFSVEDQNRFKWASILSFEHHEIMNEVMIKTDQGHPIKSTPLKWIYNDNFKGHGRNYFNLQSIPSDERRGITFDGEETIELDFVSNGPSIMYAMHDLQLKGDAYRTSGTSNRKLAKMCFTIMCNVGSKAQATRSVLNLFSEAQGSLDVELTDFPSVEKYNTYIRNELRIRKDNQALLEEIKETIDSLEAQHYQLLTDSDYGFYKKNASRLMYIDGQISTRIVQQFVEMGEPIIPIHDGFIVKKSLKRILRYVMLLEYSNVLGNKFKIEISED